MTNPYLELTRSFEGRLRALVSSGQRWSCTVWRS
jgi:hypothetical protein